MKGLLIALIILTILLCLKVGVRVQWQQSLQVKARIGWFRFRVYPGKKKKIAEPKPQAPAAAKGPVDQSRKKRQIKRYLRVLREHYAEILQFLTRTLKSPTVELLRLSVIAGGEDAAACAENYGKVWAAIGVALPMVANTWTIRKQDIQVQCDFNRKKTEISAEGEVALRVYDVLKLLAIALRLLWRLYQSFKTENKAVQQYESSVK